MRLRHPVPGARRRKPFGANPGTYRAYGLAGHEGIDTPCRSARRCAPPTTARLRCGWAQRPTATT